MAAVGLLIVLLSALCAAGALVGDAIDRREARRRPVRTIRAIPRRSVR